MKYGVVGNQKGWKEEFVFKNLRKIIKHKSDIIISGGAEGVDTFAQFFAKSQGLSIIIHYPDNELPSPERYFKRNYDIAKDSDILIAFDKKSGRAGTKNTINHARNLGKKVILFEIEVSEENKWAQDSNTQQSTK